MSEGAAGGTSPARAAANNQSNAAAVGLPVLDAEGGQQGGRARRSDDPVNPADRHVSVVPVPEQTVWAL